jgi:hypothetical protein
VRHSRVLVLAFAAAVAAAAGACGPAPRPKPPAEPWEKLEVRDAPVALYLYPEVIVRYAPDDRGAYVVRVPDGAERRGVLESLGGGDDISGDDGYVVRLGAADQRALAARPGVAGVQILQPADRRSLLVDRTTELPEVRIDLFRDATSDEVAAVGAWIAARGGRVLWSGRIALRARMPREAIAEASRLSPVRWIE